MAAAKKRTPLKRTGDNSLLELAGELDQLPTAAAEPTPAPEASTAPPAITEGRTREAVQPASNQRPVAPPPAPQPKPKGIDPYKGGTKLDAYAAAEVVEAIKYLAASDDRSQGFIVRKYMDIERLLADARAAGFIGEE